MYERNQCQKPRYVEPAPNLADVGRTVVRVDLLLDEAPARHRWLVVGSPRGRSVAYPRGTIGAKLGTSLVDRNQVNVGTTLDPPFPRPEPGSRRVGVIAHR